MFQRILIANRGEIAVRILRTCRRLNIETVAVYSDADTRSPHVALADRAVRIGGPRAEDSYLDMGRILGAAKDTDCGAIHPGYGFLSENKDFAKAVAAAGLLLVGPPPEAIARLGDKIASKDLATEAGVPVVPWHPQPLTDLGEAVAAARTMGFPVLLKPAAGGGGKGMRIVEREEAMGPALEACRNESRKAFGESGVFLERYVRDPRHVEIQIVADRHGHVLHLGERECSIQRRYQKLIEESPSPAVTAPLRKAMGEAACALARRAGYVSVGTVEFLLDPEGRFYFLEMNTRLQVEHPVTEMVTGLDLVELQLRIAAGDPLPFTQEEVLFTGWAMEARVCAEDPGRGFLPCTGMITRYAEPRGPAVRVDSGVRNGSKVSIYYDSLLAKVISLGKDRDEARKSLVEALNGYHIEGVVTNVDLLNSVLCHPDFAAGRISTGFVEEAFEGGMPSLPVDREKIVMAALAATMIYHVRNVAIRASVQPMVSRIGAGHWQGTRRPYGVRAGEDSLEISLEGTFDSRLWRATVDGRSYVVETPPFEFYRRRLKLGIDGKEHRFQIRLEGSFIIVSFSGITRTYEVYTPREWEMLRHMPGKTAKGAGNALTCPMPGQVVQVLATKEGRVFRGQTLVTLESMKMEIGVASPVDGTVVEILVAEGQNVDAGEVMIRFTT